jgi:hypothetical protein
MKSIVIIIGLVLLGIGALLFWREQTFLSKAELVTGTVVDLDYSSSSDGGGSYCPVIEFTTQNGQAVRYYGNVCTNPPSYDLGDKQEVLYDPENIDRVQMNGFWSKYVGPFVFAVIGLPFFILGLLSLIPRKA